MMTDITGRDDYVIVKALELAIEAIDELPEHQRSLNDRSDMVRLLEHVMGRIINSRLEQAVAFSVGTAQGDLRAASSALIEALKRDDELRLSFESLTFDRVVTDTLNAGFRPADPLFVEEVSRRVRRHHLRVVK
jgi:hypothetical protein